MLSYPGGERYPLFNPGVGYHKAFFFYPLMSEPV